MQTPEIGAFAGVQTVRSAERIQGPGAAEHPPAAENAVARDTAALSGRAQPAAATPEQVLGRLVSMGVADSVSLPVEPPPEAVTAAAELEAEPPAQTGTEGAEGEWRPYQPGAQAAPQLVSPDGSVRLSLYPSAEGGGTVMAEVNGILLPLDGDGTLLAGLMDGSFRLLALNQDVLLQLLDAGMAALTLPEPGQTAKAAGKEGPVQTETMGEKAQSSVSSASVTGNGEDPAPRELTEGQFRALRALLVPSQSPPQLPSQKAGGAAEWLLERQAERSFQTMTQRWLRQTEDPWRPQSLPAWTAARMEWAGRLREDPALFRAWLGTEASGTASQLDSARSGTAAPLRAGQGPEAAPAPAPRPETEDGSGALHSLLSAARTEGEEAGTMALWKNALLAENSAWRREPEDGVLARRLGEYVSQLLSGTARANTRAQAELLDLPQQPQRGEDELEKAWKRRQIAFEVDAAWTGNLREWLLHVDGWRIARCESYVNARANEWTTGLMKTQPAQFRQWLSSSVRYAASTGWFNGVTGSFPIRTLPEGFTEEDFRRWVRWDVLDYL